MGKQRQVLKNTGKRPDEDEAKVLEMPSSCQLVLMVN